MNELQMAITEALRHQTLIVRNYAGGKAKHAEVVRARIFTQAEAAGIINQWKYRNTFECMAANPPKCDICGKMAYHLYANAANEPRSDSK